MALDLEASETNVSMLTFTPIFLSVSTTVLKMKTKSPVFSLEHTLQPKE